MTDVREPLPICNSHEDRPQLSRRLPGHGLFYSLSVVEVGRDKDQLITGSRTVASPD
jgi:hypothetical protein